MNKPVVILNIRMQIQVTKDQDAEASSHPELLEDKGSDSNTHPEVPEYPDTEASPHHEVPVAGSIYDGNTYKTPEYVRTIYLYVKNID